ncbi:MAG: 50S ribosomal protein L1 [Candidatus Altiarchaeota archaeon]
MEKNEITAKVSEAIQKSKKRNFVQTVEVNFNFSNINIESAEHKLNLNIFLPKGRGKDIEIGVFADGDMNVKAKKHSKHVMDRKDVEAHTKNRRNMRRFADQCYGFIAQADMMSLIGKNWGVVLAPRGKMPQPVPQNADIKTILERQKNTIKIKSKKNPCVHVPIGTEAMTPDDLAENFMTVYNAIEQKIGKENIKSVHVKTTMGEAVSIW